MNQGKGANEMRYRRLGASGLQVSTVALGTWLTVGGSIDDETARAVLEAAAAEGINFIDTANVYAGGRAEAVIGEWLHGRRRDDWVIATKVFFPIGPGPNDRGLSRKHLFEQCHHSLGRLRTNHIDLYQCHRHDPDTALEETCRAMDDLVRAGKILYWGVSQWPAEQIRAAGKACRQAGWARPISNQPKYNLIERGVEAEILACCQEEGLGVLPYSPLAQGILTGKYRPGEAPPTESRGADPREGQWLRPLLKPQILEGAVAFAHLAESRGQTPAALALAWLLARPAVTSVISGATRPEQLRENARAATIELDRETTLALMDLFPA